MSTTSGSVRRTTSTASRPSPAVPDHLAAARLQHQLQARTGPAPGRRRPRPGSRPSRRSLAGAGSSTSTRNRPSPFGPCSQPAAEHAAPARPSPAGPAPRPGRAPRRPRSRTRSAARRRARRRVSCDRPVAVLERVGQRLLDHPVGRDVDAAGQPARRQVEVGLRRRARARGTRRPARDVGQARGRRAVRARRRRRGSGAAAGRSPRAPTGRSRPPPRAAARRAPGGRGSRSWAAAVCTTIALTECAITSCSSRAIRSRSSRTAWSRICSCWRSSSSACSASFREIRPNTYGGIASDRTNTRSVQSLSLGVEPEVGEDQQQGQHERDQAAAQRRGTGPGCRSPTM